ncbi:hypothetical protein [Propionivibrio sp.]|uniref:hypothetical protein n=1 Tax=Propionivibrio sp. TaxID=2212460 RepID=UPI0039E29AF3
MAISQPMKWILWVIGAFVSIFVVAVFLTTWLFSSLLGDQSKDEVARVVSPTGKVDAVLFETNSGATTSFGYEVHVVAHGAQSFGSPAVSMYGARRNQDAYGANLTWTSADSVAVEFLSAQFTKINSQTRSIGTQAIRISVREGIIDNSAPTGGMLYNLKGRR